MGGDVAGRAGRALLGSLLVAAVGSGGVAGEVDPWMPETLPGLLRALQVGIAQNLTRPERDVLSNATHDELRETHPELYEKIRSCSARWTDAWIRRAQREIDDLPERRVRQAAKAAGEVDRRLRDYFEARGWRYRPMQVVFLPRHLMTEPGRPSVATRGLYLTYYPDLFFVSLGPSATLRQTLIHECLHFNKTGPSLGRTLAEGIAETAATQLCLDWGMAREEPLRDANHYAKEQQVVDYIVERMIDRTGMSRKEAVETLLHAYLTGESTGMDAVLGGEAWSRIVRASRDQEKVKKTAKRLLASRRNGAGSP